MSYLRKESSYASMSHLTSRLFLAVCALSLISTLTASPRTAYAQNAKPRIAVFSGPNATVQRTEPFVTGNKARAKYGLPLLKDKDGRPLRFDNLRPQRLAAPVTVYIEAFSAHPLEKDVAELYAPPDGYVDSKPRIQ
jgi:L-asparaginase